MARLVHVAAVALLLAGCTQLQPIQLPFDAAPAASETGPLASVETVTRRDWQHVLNTGEEALLWRLRAIDAAVGSIDLQTFLWLDDPVGHLIHDRLLAAAERGVKIRILIDDSFLAGQDQPNLRFAAHPNISYRIYNPYQRRSTRVATRALLNLGEFSRLDHRMHNKAMVADGRIAIVGGRNLADQYFGHDPETNFRDMELLVGGPLVRELEASFDTYWNDDWSFPISEVAHLTTEPVARRDIARRASALSRDYPPTSTAAQKLLWSEVAAESYRARARVVADRPPDARPDAAGDRPVQVSRTLMRMIQQARSEIVIVSAYLIPTPEVLSLLRQAEARGVEVRLLTNSIASNNHLSAYAAYQNHVEELLRLGADIYEMRSDAQSRDRYVQPPPGPKKLGLHAKYMVIDRARVFVGSANFDPRSLRINTELGLVLDSRALAQRILQDSAEDFDANNAWQVRLDDEGLLWSSREEVRRTPPAEHACQQIEAWFFGHLPIEAEM